MRMWLSSGSILVKMVIAALVAASLHEWVAWGIHLDWLVYVLFIGITGIFVVQRRAIRLDRVIIGASVLFIIATLSVLNIYWSQDFSLVNFITKWAQIGLGVVLLIAASNAVTTPESKEVVLRGFVLWAIAVSLIGIYELLGKLGILPALRGDGLVGSFLVQVTREPTARIQSLFSEPAIFGTFTAVGLVGLVSYRSSSRADLCPIIGDRIATGVLLIGVVLSGSLSAYISAVGGLVLLRLTVQPVTVSVSKWTVTGVVMVTLFLAIAGTTPINIGQELLESRFDYLTNIAEGDFRQTSIYVASLTDRLNSQLEVLWLIPERPLLGFGLNQVDIGGGGASRLSRNIVGKVAGGTPNIVTLTGAETGLVGLVAVLYMWGARICESGALRRPSRGKGPPAVHYGWLGVICTVFISGLFNRAITHPLYWLLLGVSSYSFAATLSRRDRAEESSERPSERYLDE